MKRTKRILAILTAALCTFTSVPAFAVPVTESIITCDNNHFWLYSEKDGVYYKRCNYDYGGHFIQAPRGIDRFGEHGLLVMNLPNGITLHDDGCRTNNESVVMDNSGHYITRTRQELGFDLQPRNVVEVSYDASYPLKRLIDKHNIRLMDWPNFKNATELSGRNIISRLTGQMDAYCDEVARANKYYDEHPGEESRRAADVAKQLMIKSDEDAVVEKLRSWLNTWDVENSTETQKYQKLAEFLGDWQYDYALYQSYLDGHGTAGSAPTEINETGHNGYYISIVEKHGVCGDFCNACHLVAHILGLQTAEMYDPGRAHDFVLIKADGIIYGAENGIFSGPGYDYTKREDAAKLNIPTFE